MKQAGEEGKGRDTGPWDQGCHRGTTWFNLNLIFFGLTENSESEIHHYERTMHWLEDRDD